MGYDPFVICQPLSWKLELSSKDNMFTCILLHSSSHDCFHLPLLAEPSIDPKTAHMAIFPFLAGKGQRLYLIKTY